MINSINQNRLSRNRDIRRILCEIKKRVSTRIVYFSISDDSFLRNDLMDAWEILQCLDISFICKSGQNSLMATAILFSNFEHVRF